MKPAEPEAIRRCFQAIRDHSHPDLLPLVDELENRMLVHEAMLAMRERVDEVVYEIAHPGHSVKVWESDARSTSLPDVNGYPVGDPKGLYLIENGDAA